MTDLAALLTFALLAEEGDAAQKSAFHQLRNRLGISAAQSSMHPRLAGIQKQFGRDVQRRVSAILRFQNLSDSIDRVGKILPWLAREVNAQLRDPESIIEPGDWPSLLLISTWQETTNTDISAMHLPQVWEKVWLWDAGLEHQASQIFEEQNLRPDTDAYARASELLPWLKYRLAVGDRGPWPELIWLYDWVVGEHVQMPMLLTMSSATASRRSAEWHGQEEISASDEGVWGAWNDRVRDAMARGWKPSSGEIIKTWPNGFTLQDLNKSFQQLQDETAIMDHCVGRGAYGRTYWGRIQSGRGKIWSLRNKDGYPVATFEVEIRGGKPYNFPQIYAPKNSPVHPAHMGYVFDIIGPYLDRIPSYLQDKFIAYITSRDNPSFEYLLRIPRLTLEWARKEGPADDTRQAAAAVGGAPWAWKYATEVDNDAHPVTLAAVLDSGEPALLEQYAQRFSVGLQEPWFRDVLLSSTPRASFRWARGEGGREDTRARASEDTMFATLYASVVDNGPTPVTRTSAYRTPLMAFAYDRAMGAPTDEGRQVASQTAQTALYYAKYVDRKPHPVTTAGVISGPIATSDLDLDTVFSDYRAWDLKRVFTVESDSGRESSPFNEKDRARLLEMYPRVSTGLNPKVHGVWISSDEVSPETQAQATLGYAERTQARHSILRRDAPELFESDFKPGASPEEYRAISFEFWIDGLEEPKVARYWLWDPDLVEKVFGDILSHVRSHEDYSQGLGVRLGMNREIIITEIRREMEWHRGEKPLTPSKILGIYKPILEALLQISDESPYVLGRVGANSPDLISRPGTELIWTHPKAVETILGRYDSSVAARDALAKLLEIPRLRRRAISEPRAAYLVAKLIDGKQRTDTLNRVVKDADSTVLRSYIKDIVGDYAQLPPKIRMALARNGVDFHREMGFMKFQPSGGGWGESNQDYVDEITDKVVDQSVSFVMRDLTRRFRRKSAADRAHLAKIMTDTLSWAARRGRSEPPDALMALVNKYYPGSFAWLQIDSWGSYNSHVSPMKPLAATTENDKDIPTHVFIGQLGRGSDDRYLKFPSLLNSEIFIRSELLISGGAQMETDGGSGPSPAASEQLWSWWSLLIPREKRLVANRIGLDNWKTATPEDLFKGISVAWGGATPIDAELWYDSDIIHQINVSKTPLLTAFPWKTPRGQIGWILVYPSYDDQIPPNARLGGMYRVSMANE